MFSKTITTSKEYHEDAQELLVSCEEHTENVDLNLGDCCL